jgi:anti-sigma-K factor RskA
VSSGPEHRDCAAALSAYALGALSDSESARVRDHLATCHECRAELEWLRAAVDALPASAPQVQPPPELKTRVMEIVEAEAELLRAAGAAADRPPAASHQRRRRWARMPAGRPALAFGAGLAAIAVAAVLLATGGSTGTRTIQAQVTGPALSSGARASLQVRGGHAELVVRGLPAPAADHVDELWVQRGGGAPVPAGTFVVQSGSVEVARTVRPGDRVLVTVEPGGGAAAPTTPPIVVARV